MSTLLTKSPTATKENNLSFVIIFKLTTSLTSFFNTRRFNKMYQSCKNLTAEELSICDLFKLNETEPDSPLFDEDLEKLVSVTVFILFGFIFVAGEL